MIQLTSSVQHYPFEFPFETAHGLKTSQATLLVSLKMGQWEGYGEATSIPYYQQDVMEMNESLLCNKHHFLRYAYNGPERFWHFMHHLLPLQNFLIAALDIASWDMFARMKQTALHNVIGLQWKNIKPTCYTIGIQDTQVLGEILAQKQFPIYKLKVNGEQDLEHVEQVFKTQPKEIWIDANGAWKDTDAQFMLKELAKMGVTMIEQPFAIGEDEYVLKCKELNLPIDFIADESCKEAQDISNIISYYDGVNIKLSKCGGITPALQMMQKLKALSKKIMIGSMCESQAGANALAHLIPIVDYVDIDGPLLLQTNPHLVYNEGIIEVPNNLGSGYTPSLNL